jgi:hypothetical protein
MKFLFELASAGNFNVASDDVSVATSLAVKERLRKPSPLAWSPARRKRWGFFSRTGSKLGRRMPSR